MKKENLKKTIKANLLSIISSSQVTMKPKWHFVVKGLAIAIGSIAVVIILLYLISLSIFALHQNGLWFGPGFGLRGVRDLLLGLPWFLLLVAFLFIVALQILIRNYAFSYGKPLIYSIIGATTFVFIGGFIVSLTPVHKGFFDIASRNGLPLAGGIYRQYGAPPQHKNITPGKILQILEVGYQINTPRNEVMIVEVTSQTQVLSTSSFKVGDQILIYGKRQQDIIHAEAIQYLDRAIVLPSKTERE